MNTLDITRDDWTLSNSEIEEMLPPDMFDADWHFEMLG